MAHEITMSAVRRMQRRWYSLKDLFRRGQLKIGARLTLSFVAIVLLMTAGDVVAVWQFGRIEAPARRFYKADQKTLAVIRVHLDIVALQDRLARLASTQDAHRFAVEVVPLRKSFLDDVERAQQALRADVERDPTIISTLETVQAALPSQIDSMLDLVEAGDWQAVRLRLAEQLQALIGLSSSLVENVDREVAQERAQALENTQRAQRQLFFVLPVTALLTLLMAMMLGWHATRSITGPLSQLDAGAQALARGEFQHRVEVTGKDELATLGGVFNDAAQQLRDLYDALKRSEARFRSLIEHSSDLILVLDGRGTMGYVSPSSLRVLGWKPEDLLGKRFFEFLPLEDIARMEEALIGTAPSMKPALEIRFRHPDGTVAVLEVVGNNLLSEPAVAGVVINARDVTERKRAEEGLHQSQEKYRVFFEENLAGSYISTPDGLILACNPAFLRIFGLGSEEDAKATNLGSLFPSPADRNEFLQELRRHGQLDNHDREYRRKDGAPLYVRENARGTFDENGELIEIHGSLVDETERRRAEQQLWQAQKVEAVGRLAGGIAHDFNNILGIIIGHSELVLAQPEIGVSTRRHVHEILDASRRAASLTHQLLAFSRKQLLQPRVLNLNRAIEDVEKMIRRLIGDDIEVRTLLAADLENVSADPGQMEQVIINFCVNARDAMPEGGRIIIETHNVKADELFAAQHFPMKPGRYVRLAVRDTGTGMDKQTLSQVFEPFFTTKGPGKGTGLGLATVYGIVKQSGGQVWAYSEPGQGSTFSVYLPAVIGEAKCRELEAKPLEVMRGSETILLVEDAAPLRALIRELLEESGYTVLEAEDSTRAHGIADHHKDIALLLTDLSLPKVSGLVMAESLLKKRPELKVLYMSAHPTGVVDRGVQQAGTDFLQKPFTQEALAQKLRSLLDGAQ